MTFFFYGLETSSGSARNGRIMQFAGQRTNENLEPVGDPVNVLVALSDDIIPEPDAILIHGITPQRAAAEGMSEADFMAFFYEKIAQPNTVFVGYNNIRFDDEFMRAAAYRTFFDPYEWHWKDGRGRWDLLDPIRMMRALRPDGLQWPFLDGKPTVKLEEMAKANKVLHENAHDALSDVLALIDLARLFKKAQLKLFEFLLKTRDKKAVAAIASPGSTFLYASGKYDNEFLKTTVVKSLFTHPRRDAAIVYDLRYDPTDWINKTPEQLVKHWMVKYGDDLQRLPVKTMQFNRCPAIAPITVLDTISTGQIGYSDEFQKHEKIIEDHPEFIDKLKTALDIVEKEQQARLPLDTGVDNQLYDGFWTPADRSELTLIRMSDPESFSKLQPEIKNKRLRELLPLYKARNFSKLMTAEEHEAWDEYRYKKLFYPPETSLATKAYKRMQEIVSTRTLSDNDQYLLSELQLYIESIVPEPTENQ